MKAAWMRNRANIAKKLRSERMVLTMEEYINKETAIAKLTALEVTEPNATMVDAKRVLADILAADVAPVVHGRWINAPLCGNDNCRCSACGSWHNIHANLRGEIMQKFCPNCGAKMESEEG